MNAQELMKPRFEVIAVFPFCPVVIKEQLERVTNTLFIVSKIGENANVWHLSEIEKYPHLFRKLNWWDKRNIEDMPTYIKSETQVVKPDWQLEEWMGNKYLRAYDSSAKKYNMSLSFKLQLFEPATEQEYLEFVKKK